MEPLTEKQRQILDYIVDWQRRNGAPPTIREIARHFGFRSPKAAADHLTALARKGYLARTTGTARGLRILSPAGEDHETPRGIPIVGDVAAGLPILAAENVLGSLSMDDHFGGGVLFAVRVKGDSMVDFGIFEGDHVIVRKSPIVENNAIYVVYLEGEATVKKLVRTNGGFQLIAGNPRYPPVDITADTAGFSIAGPVVGVVRKM